MSLDIIILLNFEDEINGLLACSKVDKLNFASDQYDCSEEFVPESRIHCTDILLHDDAAHAMGHNEDGDITGWCQCLTDYFLMF